MSKLQPWQVIDSRQILAVEPWFSIAVQEIRLPNGTVIDDYHQIVFPEYVILFAQTLDGKVIVEQSYKHGVGKVTLTLPAGALEDGEDPLAAAQRELLEETGYRSSEWRSLGAFYNHGSYGCGRGYLFIAQNAHKVAEPASGDLEEMEIILMEPQDMANAIQKGDVELMGTMATFALVTNPLFSAMGIEQT